MRIPPLALAMLLAAMCPARAADMAPKPLEARAPSAAFAGPQRDILTLNTENDLYGRGSDRGYTNGARASLLKVNPEIPSFVRAIADAVPTIGINQTTSLFYSLGQNLFTPDDIGKTTLGPGDRPWAAFLYGSAGIATLKGSRKDELEATVGVIGPAALGKPIQRFIHRHVSDSPAPRGWHQQLKNEPVVMLGWQRSWMEFADGNIGPLYWSMTPHIGVTLGNAYTFADGGFTLRLSPDDYRWQDTPVRVRPAIPGTGFFEMPEKHWGWYLFAGVDSRVMGRNIFLDGNSFTDSASVDKKTFVTDFNAGAALTYDRLRVSYTLVYRTKEFETQDEPDLFGAISVGWRF